MLKMPNGHGKRPKTNQGMRANRTIHGSRAKSSKLATKELKSVISNFNLSADNIVEVDQNDD